MTHKKLLIIQKTKADHRFFYVAFYLHDSTHTIDKHSKRLSLTTFETRIQFNITKWFWKGKFSLHHHENCFFFIFDHR